jgi:hypothetical protein
MEHFGAYVRLTALLLFTSSFSFSQECSKELLRKKTGTWKAGQQGSIANVSAADLTKEKAVITSVHKLISSQYNPTGCEVSYSTVFGKQMSAGNNWVGDPYQYVMYILRYLCESNNSDKSKYYVDHATPTTVTVTANVLHSLNTLYAAELPADDSRGYLKLRQKPQTIDGAWFMDEEIVGDYGTSSEIKEYRWLITYNDTLPFDYVTRREYLLIQKTRLDQSIKDSPSEKEYLTKFLNNINEFLEKPEAELSKPAICMWNDEQRFEKFVEEGTRGSFIAVKPNLGYYRKALPKSSPQFFTVVFKISKGDPVFSDNYEAIKKALDFSTLKKMLGK